METDGEKRMKMTTDTEYSKQLQQKIRKITKHIVEEEMKCWWFVSFHYNDNHTNHYVRGLPVGEIKLLNDVAHLKRILYRFIYKNRDATIKGAGSYPYPRMLFFHEVSHSGSGQFHTHLILEKMPSSLNNYKAMQNLFRRGLPSKVSALSKKKSVDIQRMCPDNPDYGISNYLTKQTMPSRISLDAFNSDLERNNNEKKSTYNHISDRTNTFTR
jgi:hypothetical protein